MRLPTRLSRRNPHVHKNTFGHVLILAGSPRMAGAAALTGLAAMRSGAGLVTLGVPRSLNAVVQKKISPVLMTFPLPETRKKTLSVSACRPLKSQLKKFRAVGVGPGLSEDKSTRNLILKLIETVSLPMVIDADGLNALARKPEVINKCRHPRILTPHPGEMVRLTGLSKDQIASNRRNIAREFARIHGCIVLLKGHNTIVADPSGKIYTNRSGNAGMATAGSGDVLTGMITAFLGQGLAPFEAAKLGAYLHGKAGDLSARKKTRLAMIATDIIDSIPLALKKMK